MQAGLVGSYLDHMVDPGEGVSEHKQAENPRVSDCAHEFFLIILFNCGRVKPHPPKEGFSHPIKLHHLKKNPRDKHKPPEEEFRNRHARSHDTFSLAEDISKTKNKGCYQQNVMNSSDYTLV